MLIIADLMAADFRQILDGEGAAETLIFATAGTADAVVEETTNAAEQMPGGARATRSFTAHCLRADLSAVPRIREKVTFNGLTFAVTSVRDFTSTPFVEIDFAEKN